MKTLIIAAISALVFLSGCTSLLLKPADFGWPVESVLKVDNNGNVVEKRYSFSFNTRELFLAETSDSSGFRGKELIIIRGNKGYYYMTSENFRNVYVFYPDNGVLALSDKIEIKANEGMKDPAFNQRAPFIELVYDNNKKLYLNKDGMTKENNK